MGFWQKDNTNRPVQLWPRSFIPKNLRWSTSALLTKWFENNFTNGYPVIVSSGRSAISIISKSFANHDINLFPYANTCVLRALSLTSDANLKTHLFNAPDVIGLNVVYHQWGYTDIFAPREPFIEDRVDTFYKLNSSVRHLGGRFEIWSLSKILGIRSGSVIWCKNKEDHSKIVNTVLIQSKFFSYWKYILRILVDLWPIKFYKIWERAELNNSRLSFFDILEIAGSVKKWSEYYSRKESSITKFVDNYSSCFKDSEIKNIHRTIETGVLPSGLITEMELPHNLKVPFIKLHKFNYTSTNVGTPNIRIVSFIPTHLL